MGTLSFFPSAESHFFNATFLVDNNQSNANMIDPPIHLFLFITMWIVLLVTIIFGATGNLLVLYVYINRKDNKTCTFFIKILAIVDLIICLLLAPLELYQITVGIRNELLCKAYGFLSTHVLYSTFLITIIALDRYFCICWPLYKIITIRRARVIVIVCGLVSSLLAIIPMSEYSTVEHYLHVHDNHSAHFSLKPNDDNTIPTYKHVEHLKVSASMVPFTLGNATAVSCSPKFSIQLRLSKFLDAYRMFHATLFATCVLLVLILYAFIYNAVYQRRVTRTRKLSAYRRIIRSYLMHNETEHTELSASSSPKTARSRRRRQRRNARRHHNNQNSPSTLSLICCYCCQIHDDYRHELQRPSESAFHEPLHEGQRQNYHRHLHDEPSSVVTHTHRTRPQVVLEVNGGRGKRYSAISMTSMTYLTSGVWDESSPTNMFRSRVSSIAATTYCGTEHSSASRPSTSTEDSFDQTSKLLSASNTLSPVRSITPSTSTHLTVPGQQSSLLSPSAAAEIQIKENPSNVSELPRSVSQCANFLHPSIVRKPSNTLSLRQAQRLSDVSVHQRKVSFMTSAGIIDQCISEDPPSANEQSTLSPTSSFLVTQQPVPSQVNPHHLTVQLNNQRSLSTVSSIDPRQSAARNYSISSARRPSTFDGETQRILDRQQTQERLANIRTTFTLFMVTATFLIMYLPSIIHKLFSIKPHAYREILFLLYYINSACNPLIYSFFNVNFRNDIRRIYECQKREYLARQY